MESIFLVVEQGHQTQSWRARKNIDPVWGCCAKHGGPKVSCDIIETILRKLEGLPVMNGLVFRQDLEPVYKRQLNALFDGMTV